MPARPPPPPASTEAGSPSRLHRSFRMMRHLALAIAVAFGGALAAPAIAQQPAARQPAAQQTPEQVVQGIAHQLDTDVAGHKAELQRNREKVIGIVNQVFLPHFDVDY